MDMQKGRNARLGITTYQATPTPREPAFNNPQCQKRCRSLGDGFNP
jgi:hypothetical protein